MKKNTLKHRLQCGEHILNGWLHLPDSFTAEIMANVGWDVLTVDMQHGMMGWDTAFSMLQSIATTDVVPMARCTALDQGQIMRLLDAGAAGIICPLINTADDCECFVQACRYPPRGIRSFGPTRAKICYSNDYAAHANDEVLTWAMVETLQAIDNLEAIVKTESLDGVFVGSSDLKLSITGDPGGTAIPAKFAQALKHIASTCQKNGVIAGLWCNSIAAAKNAFDMGYQLVSVQSDAMIVHQNASQLVAGLKALLSKQQKH